MSLSLLGSNHQSKQPPNLLLFMQLSSRCFASGLKLEVKSKICGTDHLAYSNLYGQELFYLNGNLVDKVLFCKSLQLHFDDPCVFDGYTGTDYCDLDLSLGGGARKLLQESKKEDKSDRNPNSSSTKVRIAAAGTLLTCFAFICPCLYRKKGATAHTVLTNDPNSMDSASPLEMNVHSLHGKVPGSPQRIGEGGFGTVYKAQLDSGQLVAIKRAKKEHFESLQTEFSSEVELLAKIYHRNLVKLLGFVDEGNDRLIITEYVPNGTLRDHLDGQRGKILDFNQRLEIAIDVAHGVTYLHLYGEKQIIHRDVKSSNVLLTESMRAKVADFGFARFGPMDSDRTHISTKVKGTVGFLDPEYMITYQLTAKSDVYSFGVLLIEILTGRRLVEVRRPIEGRVTLRWAFRKYNEGHVAELVDQTMDEAVDVEILVKMFGLAFQCAAPRRNDRPEMKSVGEQLWAIRAHHLNLKSSRRKRLVQEI